MNFTDGKPRTATEDECGASWGGAKPGKGFRCYLCGHHFEAGHTWRFVYDNDGGGGGFGNFLVCAGCDGHDVRDRWKKRCEQARKEFWWLRMNT